MPVASAPPEGVALISDPFHAVAVDGSAAQLPDSAAGRAFFLDLDGTLIDISGSVYLLTDS